MDTVSDKLAGLTKWLDARGDYYVLPKRQNLGEPSVVIFPVESRVIAVLLKHPRNSLTPLQERYMAQLRAIGVAGTVAFSLDDAKRFVEQQSRRKHGS